MLHFYGNAALTQQDEAAAYTDRHQDDTLACELKIRHPPCERGRLRPRLLCHRDFRSGLLAGVTIVKLPTLQTWIGARSANWLGLARVCDNRVYAGAGATFHRPVFHFLSDCIRVYRRRL